MGQMNTTLRNIAVTPLVILARVPLMFPLLALMKLGRVAEYIFDALNSVIPGWERGRRK